MEIRYLILVHKNPAQFARLIRALEMPAAFFYVHIDRRACADDFRKSLADTKTKVHFLEERYCVNWGGFSTVLATLALMKQCLKESLPDDRLILLSGQDYPIKSTDSIASFFAEHSQREFVSWWRLPSAAWKTEDGGNDRYQYYWFIDSLHLRYAEMLFRWQKKLGLKRKLPDFVSPVGGSQWFLLTARCGHLILDYCTKNPRFLHFWSTTRLSDEMFFNTILLNSEISTRVENNGLKYLDWLKGPEYPRILRLDDFPLIKESQHLFARKFDASIKESSLLMDKIDRETLFESKKVKSI